MLPSGTVGCYPNLCTLSCCSLILNKCVIIASWIFMHTVLQQDIYISDSNEGNTHLLAPFVFHFTLFFCLLLKNRYIRDMLMILETLIMHGWRQKLWTTMMKQVNWLMFIKLGKRHPDTCGMNAHQRAFAFSKLLIALANFLTEICHLHS